MIELAIHHITAAKALELKNDLVASGLIMDQDFTWHYHQSVYDTFGHEAPEPSHVIFEFATDQLATFFRLKWAGNEI